MFRFKSTDWLYCRSHSFLLTVTHLLQNVWEDHQSVKYIYIYLYLYFFCLFCPVVKPLEVFLSMFQHSFLVSMNINFENIAFVSAGVPSPPGLDFVIIPNILCSASNHRSGSNGKWWGWVLNRIVIALQGDPALRQFKIIRQSEASVFRQGKMGYFWSKVRIRGSSLNLSDSLKSIEKCLS